MQTSYTKAIPTTTVIANKGVTSSTDEDTPVPEQRHLIEQAIGERQINQITLVEKLKEQFGARVVDGVVNWEVKVSISISIVKEY
jgi:hypothetical protein